MNPSRSVLMIASRDHATIADSHDASSNRPSTIGFRPHGGRPFRHAGSAYVVPEEVFEAGKNLAPTAQPNQENVTVEDVRAACGGQGQRDAGRGVTSASVSPSAHLMASKYICVTSRLSQVSGA